MEPCSIVNFDAEYNVRNKYWWLTYSWIESKDINEYESICPSKRWTSYKTFKDLSSMFAFITTFTGPLAGGGSHVHRPR
jgi:hypothetical protein